jgi:MFS family permease
MLRQRLRMSKGDFEPYYSLLYSVYSLPNIVLPFFGGVFVDRFGARVCLLVFTFFIVIGQVRPRFKHAASPSSDLKKAHVALLFVLRAHLDSSWSWRSARRTGASR